MSEKVTFSCGWSELTQCRVKWLFLWWPWETVHILQQHGISWSNYLLILTMTTASTMMMMIMIRACRTSVRIILQRRQLRKRVGDWENNIKVYLQGEKIIKTRNEFNFFALGVRRQVLALFVTSRFFFLFFFVYWFSKRLFTYSMVQSPSWEANWFADSQEIPRISRNPKVHYRTHKRPPPVSILGQPNLVHIPTAHLLEIHPNIIHPSTPRSPQWSPSLRFPQQEPIQPPLLTHTRHMPSPSHSYRFYHLHNIWWGVQII